MAGAGPGRVVRLCYARGRVPVAVGPVLPKPPLLLPSEPPQLFGLRAPAHQAGWRVGTSVPTPLRRPGERQAAPQRDERYSVHELREPVGCRRVAGADVVR